MATENWVNIGLGSSLLPDGQAITWTNVDLSSVRSNDILLRAISQQVSQPSITVIGTVCLNLVNSLGSSHSMWWRTFWSRLVQVMAWDLFSAKPLAQTILNYCPLNPREPTLMKFESKYKNGIEENTLATVDCKMVALLLRLHCVNRKK